MKKLLIACLVALILFGCKGKEISISNANEEIWSNTSKTYTASDLFKSMKTQDYTSNVIASIEKIMAQKEGIDISKLEKEAQEEYEQIINSGYESYIDYYYGSKEGYLNNTVSGKIVNELKKIIINEKFDELTAEHMPYMAEIVYFNTQDEAQKVIDDYKSGLGTFAFVASENGYTDVIENKVYTDSSDLPIEVKDTIMASNINTEVLGPIQTSLASSDNQGNNVVTPRYYVVNLTSKDVNTFKDEFIDYVSTQLYTADETVNDFSKKYKVTIHDQTTYDLLKDKYPGFEH